MVFRLGCNEPRLLVGAWLDTGRPFMVPRDTGRGEVWYEGDGERDWLRRLTVATVRDGVEAPKLLLMPLPSGRFNECAVFSKFPSPWPNGPGYEGLLLPFKSCRVDAVAGEPLRLRLPADDVGLWDGILALICPL